MSTIPNISFLIRILDCSKKRTIDEITLILNPAVVGGFFISSFGCSGKRF
jgi:hypothetical protein